MPQHGTALCCADTGRVASKLEGEILCVSLVLGGGARLWEPPEQKLL